MSGHSHEGLVLLYGQGTCPWHRKFISLLTLSEGKRNTNSVHKNKLLYSDWQHACLNGLEHGHFLFVIYTGTSQGSESAGDTQYLLFLNNCPRNCGLFLTCVCHNVLISFIALLPRIWFFFRKQMHTCASTHMHMKIKHTTAHQK